MQWDNGATNPLSGIVVPFPVLIMSENYKLIMPFYRHFTIYFLDFTMGSFLRRSLTGMNYQADCEHQLDSADTIPLSKQGLLLKPKLPEVLHKNQRQLLRTKKR